MALSHQPWGDEGDWKVPFREEGRKGWRVQGDSPPPLWVPGGSSIRFMCWERSNALGPTGFPPPPGSRKPFKSPAGSRKTAPRGISNLGDLLPLESWTFWPIVSWDNWRTILTSWTTMWFTSL